ncbi:hypothetical protein BKA60DRAFT_588221 [Fusarium oxysporum]|nr:hypothetical protein BKA60DRAFT_588221 [Fusarium oxysporum]
MHRRFKAWMNSKRHSRQRTPQNPEMPRLPNPRPYTLTPSPSQEQITTLSETVPFFRLPLELRRKILIHAFGNRTVHMDLALAHPLREPLNEERTCYRSTNPAHRFYQEAGHLWPYTKENLGLDRSRPKYWQWRGCVCHRLPPPRFKITLDFHSYIKPADDRCCEGWAAFCTLWTKRTDKPDSCWIGAMGWMALDLPPSVRTEVLYGTNTIHISSKPLLTNLSTLIPPRSLSLISSLEVVFWLETYEQQGKAFPNLQQLEKDLLILDTHFPSLLSIHLGLRLDLPIIEDNRTNIKRRPAYVLDMLQSIDAFLKRRGDKPEFGHLRDPLLLSISQSAYKDFQNEVRHNDQYYVRKSGVQVWRPLSPGPFVLDDKGDICNETASNGYWIWGDYEDRYEMEKRPLAM